MEKYTRVQVEVILTADEKALLDHYVKDHNRRFEKNTPRSYQWTIKRLLELTIRGVIDQMMKQRSVWAVFKELLPL